MDLDRQQPHFRSSTGTTTSELFICFSSRLSSSSSMKLSKSILSPGRAARDGGPVCLSSSLSRRLRANGSLKGGASPFFSTSGKKRGCAFENPEPSSPKVTCIGQVRVKTKKKVKQSRKRRSGEVSFRKIEQDQHEQRQSNSNQRWVHLPVSICEALRSFGSEFSCLFPCKSSCFSRSGNEKQSENVFARWLVSVDDVDVDEVVSSRRHVFEDIEVKEEDEDARVSICIPPKNALLLMRCRSDPIKMASLANRDPQKDEVVQLPDHDEEEEEDEEDKDVVVSVPVPEETSMDANKDEVIIQVPENEDEDETVAVPQETTMEEEIQHDAEEESSHEETITEQENAENYQIEEKLSQKSEEEEDEEEEEETEIPPPPTENQDEEDEEEEEAVLPDCLLLMMCEPKLSMEVSKETWVYTTDFVVDTKPKPEKKKQQPPRSSCSLPAAAAAASMATVIEQKLVNAVAYEPFVLTRCKSEPMRTAAAKLIPDSCFWKNAVRKLEPLRRDTLGVGAAGVGF